MSVSMAMLALLSQEPSHGFALKQRYDELLAGEKKILAGQVYSTLSRLQRDGYCVGLGFEKSSAADKQVYAITENGVSAVHEWIKQPSIPTGRPGEIFSKVILALVTGLDPSSVLETHREVYLTKMRTIRAAQRTSDTVDKLAGDYELAHLQADLDWVELAAARLPQLREDLS